MLEGHQVYPEQRRLSYRAAKEMRMEKCKPLSASAGLFGLPSLWHALTGPLHRMHSGVTTNRMQLRSGQARRPIDFVFSPGGDHGCPVRHGRDILTTLVALNRLHCSYCGMPFCAANPDHPNDRPDTAAPPCNLTYEVSGGAGL